jgi:voltage-gated potassium channel
MATSRNEAGDREWQRRLFAVAFEDGTRLGRAFDVGLLVAILLSVLAVMLESVEEVRASYATFFGVAEWTFTVLFTAEYVLRLACVKKPLRYAGSFFGVVDLMALAPTYLGLLVFHSHYFLVVRALRLVRVFRILKMGRYVEAGDAIWGALRAARRKISVFLIAVLSIVSVVGTLMYLIEGAASGFTSIPTSIYWAIVTLTTVGYGDIAPATAAGKMLASALMIVGYSVIAVPTGIVTAEMGRARGGTTERCAGCGLEGHAGDAHYCRRCGRRLGGLDA